MYRVPHPAGEGAHRGAGAGCDRGRDPGAGRAPGGEGIEKVILGAASDYWRIWFYLLEGAGLSVQLVNAREVKNAPGRLKPGKLDAVWLAKLTERGMLRPSFVPSAGIRLLRD